MKYCCGRFEDDTKAFKIYWHEILKTWSIQEYDMEYGEYYDIIGDIQYCPFCGKKLEVDEIIQEKK